MIIVEGPDGGGKSTLVRALADGLGLPIAPRVVAEDTTALVDLKAWVDDNLKKGFVRTLFDRHRLISEFIYGPTLKPVMADGFTDQLWVTRSIAQFYQLRPIIIYAIPPLDNVLANTRGPENAAVADRIEAIYTAYLLRAAVDEELFSHTLYYDYTQHDVHDVIDAVSADLDYRK